MTDGNVMAVDFGNARHFFIRLCKRHYGCAETRLCTAGAVSELRVDGYLFPWGGFVLYADTKKVWSNGSYGRRQRASCGTFTSKFAACRNNSLHKEIDRLTKKFPQRTVFHEHRVLAPAWFQTWEKLLK